MNHRPGRVAALDLGSKRIGVASTDLTQTLASPHIVIQRSGNLDVDHRVIVREIETELEAVRVVIGLPISLDGREGPAVQLIRAEVEILAPKLSVPVELFDERFTTTMAHASMRERNMRGEARRKTVDMVAAAVLLQSWLDSRSPSGSEE
jgi:putative holliday junction resolvase